MANFDLCNVLITIIAQITLELAVLLIVLRHLQELFEHLVAVLGHPVDVRINRVHCRRPEAMWELGVVFVAGDELFHLDFD